MKKDEIKTSEQTWDAIAESFDSTRRKTWQQCIKFINNLPKTSTVADIGCGNGRHLIPCAEHCQKVIGVDISQKLLDIVQKKVDEKNLKNVELIHADVTDIPIEDNSIDAVLYIAALHNVECKKNRIKSLQEIKRILKDDGTALISVWSRWQDKYRKQFLKKWFKPPEATEFGDIDIYWRQHGLDIPRFYHLYSKKEFIEDLKSADLEIKTIEEVKLHSKKHPDNYFASVKKI